MTIAVILEIINGVLKFPTEILKLIRILKQTPEQAHQALIDQISKEAETYLEKGTRPNWND